MAYVEQRTRSWRLLTNCLTEMWTAFGIMLGTAINLAVFKLAGPLNWRLMLGTKVVPIYVPTFFR